MFKDLTVWSVLFSVGIIALFAGCGYMAMLNEMGKKFFKDRKQFLVFLVCATVLASFTTAFIYKDVEVRCDNFKTVFEKYDQVTEVSMFNMETGTTVVKRLENVFMSKADDVVQSATSENADEATDTQSVTYKEIHMNFWGKLVVEDFNPETETLVFADADNRVKNSDDEVVEKQLEMFPIYFGTEVPAAVESFLELNAGKAIDVKVNADETIRAFVIDTVNTNDLYEVASKLKSHTTLFVVPFAMTSDGDYLVADEDGVIYLMNTDRTSEQNGTVYIKNFATFEKKTTVFEYTLTQIDKADISRTADLTKNSIKNKLAAVAETPQYDEAADKEFNEKQGTANTETTIAATVKETAKNAKTEK